MPSTVYQKKFEKQDLEIFALDTDLAQPNLYTRNSNNNELCPWDAQLAWLRNELESSTAKWKIVLGHHPVNSDYVRNTHDSERFRNMNKLSKIIESSANIYLSGHDHSLQILPVNRENYTNLTSGCLQVISGSGGTYDTIKGYNRNRSFVRSQPGQIGFVSLNISKEHIEIQTFVGTKDQSFSKLNSIWVYPNLTFSSDSSEPPRQEETYLNETSEDPIKFLLNII